MSDRYAGLPITDDDTAQTLFAKLTAAAATLMREVYPRLCAGTAARLTIGCHAGNHSLTASQSCEATKFCRAIASR